MLKDIKRIYPGFEAISHPLNISKKTNNQRRLLMRTIYLNNTPKFTN